MADTLISPSPIEVTIAGRTCRLSYPMRAAILYQRETARIDRSRPRPADPDPRCVCGARHSQHTGPSLIRLSDDKELLCVRFRVEDPLAGDSLFVIETWRKIDLNIDPERWLACLWCGLHERQGDGSIKPQLTMAQLEDAIGIAASTREINERMFEALQAWMPKRSPNVAAPGEPAPADSGKVAEELKAIAEAKRLPTSIDSTPEPGSATDSAQQNS